MAVEFSLFRKNTYCFNKSFSSQPKKDQLGYRQFPSDEDFFFFFLRLKARRLQKAGAVGGVVVDSSPSSSSEAAPLFAMSGDGTDDVRIPLVFLYSSDADVLLQALNDDPHLQVRPLPFRLQIHPTLTRFDIDVCR